MRCWIFKYYVLCCAGTVGLAIVGLAILLSHFVVDSSPIISARVRILVDESTEKKPIAASVLLNECPLSPEDIPEAVRYINANPNFRSYHLLMAIRRYYRFSYDEISAERKSSVLCSALRNSQCLNDWGNLSPSGSGDKAVAKALVETGNDGLRFLEPILADDSPAQLFGSKDATDSYIYRYRRKDFAYRYCMLILGQCPEFKKNARERDEAIKELRRALIKSREPSK